MTSDKYGNVLLAVLIVLIIIWIYRSNIDFFTQHKPVCNDVDARCYSVVDNFEPDTHETASELLAKLNAFSIKLMRHLRNKYLWNDYGSEYCKNTVKFLLENYSPDAIIENNPTSDVNTSYVEDKGKVFALCLREKQSGKHKFHDSQILEFVVLHEMAHMSTPKIGHDAPEFWINFKFLIKEAKHIGIHQPINYAIHPINYCSLYVDYNPYFDDSVPFI